MAESVNISNLAPLPTTPTEQRGVTFQETPRTASTWGIGTIFTSIAQRTMAAFSPAKQPPNSDAATSTGPSTANLDTVPSTIRPSSPSTPTRSPGMNVDAPLSLPSQPHPENQATLSNTGDTPGNYPTSKLAPRRRSQHTSQSARSNQPHVTSHAIDPSAMLVDDLEDTTTRIIKPSAVDKGKGKEHQRTDFGDNTTEPLSDAPTDKEQKKKKKKKKRNLESLPPGTPRAARWKDNQPSPQSAGSLSLPAASKGKARADDQVSINRASVGARVDEDTEYDGENEGVSTRTPDFLESIFI